MAGSGASPPSESENVLLSRVLCCVGVLTMSGPEGLGTVDTPLPLALGGVWWCSTQPPQCGDQRRVRRSGVFTRSDQCI
eukprot:220039-Pleurochrysis_carterae.AAC.1